MKVIELIQDITGVEFSVLVTFSVLTYLIVRGCVKISRAIRNNRKSSAVN